MKKQANILSDHNALLDSAHYIDTTLFLDPTGDGKTYMIKEPMCLDINQCLVM